MGGEGIVITATDGKGNDVSGSFRAWLWFVGTFGTESSNSPAANRFYKFYKKFDFYTVESVWNYWSSGDSTRLVFREGQGPVSNPQVREVRGL